MSTAETDPMHPAVLEPIWQPAASFAQRAHRHQQRKDDRTPYAAHPVRVAFTCAMIFGVRDDDVIAAAMLHDTIEDCAVDYDEVLEAFNETVAAYVQVMTKDMRLPHRDREAAYDAQLAAGPWQGRLIKLADVYDNLCDAHEPTMVKSAIRKAERALALAADDPECALARERLEQLIVRRRPDAAGR